MVNLKYRFAAKRNQGGTMVQIDFAPDIEDGGMATMIADIIKGNLKEKPKREKDFNALNGNIYMHAEDAEVDMTILF
jgi:hypothetical protein